jgi:hypothetical protein
VGVHRKNLVELIEALTGDGKKIIGYGLSTKGNVLLQFCGLTRRYIPFIAEVNEELTAFTLRMRRSFRSSYHLQSRLACPTLDWELAEMMMRAK